MAVGSVSVPRLSALSRRSSATGTRNGTTGACVSAVADSPRPTAAAVRARGRRTANSLPWPRPGAVRADPPAVHLDQACAPGTGRCPCPPCERSVSDSPWVNMSKRRGIMLGRMPMPLSLTAQLDLLADRLHRQPDAAAGRSVLGGVDQQVGEHLRQVASGRRRHTAAATGRLERKRVPRSSISGRHLGACSARLQLQPLEAQRGLPVVMRETSSRSSTRRTIAFTWRSITSRPGALRRRRGRSRRRWTALRIGASGLRSSCASVAMKLVLLAVGAPFTPVRQLPISDLLRSARSSGPPPLAFSSPAHGDQVPDHTAVQLQAGLLVEVRLTAGERLHAT